MEESKGRRTQRKSGKTGIATDWVLEKLKNCSIVLFFRDTAFREDLSPEKKDVGREPLGKRMSDAGKIPRNAFSRTRRDQKTRMEDYLDAV